MCDWVWLHTGVLENGCAWLFESEGQPKGQVHWGVLGPWLYTPGVIMPLLREADSQCQGLEPQRHSGLVCVLAWVFVSP